MIIIACTTIIGSWYAASWLKNGWWLFLIVPSLAIGAAVVVVAIEAVRTPASLTLVLAASSYDLSFGLPLATVVAVVVASIVRVRRRIAARAAS